MLSEGHPWNMLYLSNMGNRVFHRLSHFARVESIAALFILCLSLFCQAFPLCFSSFHLRDVCRCASKARARVHKSYRAVYTRGLHDSHCHLWEFKRVLCATRWNGFYFGWMRFLHKLCFILSIWVESGFVFRFCDHVHAAKNFKRFCHHVLTLISKV